MIILICWCIMVKRSEMVIYICFLDPLQWSEARHVGYHLLWRRKMGWSGITKIEGEVEVRCLEKPFGTCREPQDFEAEKCHCFYKKVYRTSVKPSSKFLKCAYKWVYWPHIDLGRKSYSQPNILQVIYITF